jgi:mannonate dehydratase
LTRRALLELPLAAGTLSALGCATSRDARLRAGRNVQDASDIKLARRVPATLSDDDLLFFKQIGLRWVRVDLTREQANVDTLRQVQARYARFGLRIFSAVHPVQGSTKIGLGLPGRDEEIEEYRSFLRTLGGLGIGVAGYAFHPGNTYSTGRVEHRGYSAREFDLETFRTRHETLRFGREYPAEVMWDNYAYFMNAVLPVAEEANVRLALHPDDPPLPMMNGVAKLFCHVDGYRRAERIAGGSRHWGLLFCVGTWAEGGDRTGMSVVDMIHEFGGRGKILAVHFRNVSGPLPRFHETLPDDGYLDMYAVMKALREVGFDGTVIPDHIPRLAGDHGHQRQGTAYCIAYMRALLHRANAQVG